MELFTFGLSKEKALNNRRCIIINDLWNVTGVGKNIIVNFTK